MSVEEFAALAKTIGVPGAIMAAFMLWAARNGGAKDDPSRADIITKLDKMDDKLDGVRDRLTNQEAAMRELSRRVDRLDR